MHSVQIPHCTSGGTYHVNDMYIATILKRTYYAQLDARHALQIV